MAAPKTRHRAVVKRGDALLAQDDTPAQGKGTKPKTFQISLLTANQYPTTKKAILLMKLEIVVTNSFPASDRQLMYVSEVINQAVTEIQPLEPSGEVPSFPLHISSLVICRDSK